MCRSNVSNHSTNERKCIREQCRRDVCMPLCCIFFFFEFKYFFKILTKQNFHTIFWQFFFFSRIKGEKNRIKTKYWVILKRKSNFWLSIHNCDSQQVRIPRKREESQNYTLFSFLSILIFFPPSFFFFKKHQKSEKSLKFQAKTSEFWEKLEDTKNAKKSIIILTEKKCKRFRIPGKD